MSKKKSKSMKKGFEIQKAYKVFYYHFPEVITRLTGSVDLFINESRQLKFADKNKLDNLKELNSKIIITKTQVMDGLFQTFPKDNLRAVLEPEEIITFGECFNRIMHESKSGSVKSINMLANDIDKLKRDLNEFCYSTGSIIQSSCRNLDESFQDCERQFKYVTQIITAAIFIPENTERNKLRSVNRTQPCRIAGKHMLGSIEYVLTVISDLNERTEKGAEIFKKAMKVIQDIKGSNKDLSKELSMDQELSLDRNQIDLLNILFTKFFYNLIVNILAKHPGLLRSSRVNINIRIIDSSQNPHYDINKSTFDNINIVLVLTPEMVYGILKDYSSKNPHSYELEKVIVHEFMHAYDLRLPEEFDLKMIQYLEKEYGPLDEMTKAIASVFSHLREEGLAKLSESWHTISKYGPEYHLDVNFKGIKINLQDQKKVMKGLLEKFLSNSNPDLKTSVREIYQTGYLHNLGFFLILILFIGRYGGMMEWHNNYMFLQKKNIKTIEEFMKIVSLYRVDRFIKETFFELERLNIHEHPLDKDVFDSMPDRVKRELYRIFGIK